MAGAIESIQKFFGRPYTSFILRDLTFFVSGGIVLFLAIQEPGDLITDYLRLNDKTSWIGILIVLALSYIIGVILQEGARLLLEPASE